MKRSEIFVLPAYFDRYMTLVDDVTVLEALQIGLQEIETLDMSIYEKIGNQVYAPNKWTLKDIWQHIIDCERVFAYRALAFARGEVEVMTFDEDTYAVNAEASNRNLQEILEEAMLVRKATIALFVSFTEKSLSQIGMGFKGPYTVRDIGFVIAGHQRWHTAVIQERYVPMIANK